MYRPDKKNLFDLMILVLEEQILFFVQYTSKQFCK